jgi:hypothetical protein
MAGDKWNELFVSLGCNDNYEQTHEPTERGYVTDCYRRNTETGCERIAAITEHYT